MKMDDNFVINIIWKEEKIKEVDDENLSKKEIEKFIYNIEKSKESKQVFTKKNVEKEIKQNYIYAFFLIIFVVIVGNLWEAFGPTGDFASNIAGVLIMGAGFSFLGLIISPFSTYKNIIFEIDNLGQERILKQNVFGSISTVLNLKNIEEIKFVKGNVNSYFLVDEQNDKKISDKSLIFVVVSEDQDQVNNVQKFLNDKVL